MINESILITIFLLISFLICFLLIVNVKKLYDDLKFHDDMIMRSIEKINELENEIKKLKEINKKKKCKTCVIGVRADDNEQCCYVYEGDSVPYYGINFLYCPECGHKIKIEGVK